MSAEPETVTKNLSTFLAFRSVLLTPGLVGPVLFLVREALSTPGAAMPLLVATFDPVLPQQLSS